MPRSIWNGVITFGMVSIPVGLFTATQEKDVRFHQLHKKDGSRIREKKWCPVCDRAVESDEIVRGYEVSKGQYVTMSPEDFENLPVASKHTIEVSGFVNEEEVDPIFYDTSYYLEPTEAGVKPFALFLRALQEKKVVAISKIALRSKENLCLLRPGDKTVILETLYYADEIREQADAGVDKVQVDERELKMAESLVDLMVEKFEPEKYHDEYRAALMKVIEAKLHGGQVQEAPSEPQPTKVYDLMDALKASLQEAQKRKSV